MTYSHIRTLAVVLIIGVGISTAGAPLSGFQPTRWTPMDAYILQPLAGGPKSVQLLSPDGTLLSSARFVYDSAGRLTEERFTDAAGNDAGSNRYTYADGRIKEETLLNTAGKVIGRTKFIYKEKQLVALEQFDPDHKLVSRQDFAYKEGRIVQGVETTGEQKDQFVIDYQDQKPVAMTVKSSEHGQLSRITYRYDEQGRLKQRVRETFGNFSRCDYIYDGQGRIEAYAYYNQINGQWEREKKLQFAY